MNAQQARDLGEHLSGLLAQGQVAAAKDLLLPTLQARTSFALLDRLGQAIGGGPREPVEAFAERVAADRTEGGWVVIAGILRERLAWDMPGAFERARTFILHADVWYAADIFGERVPGPALLLDFGQALDLLQPWRNDPERWVRRAVGVAVHFWTKRAGGEVALRPQAEKLLAFLEPMFEERNVDAVKGVGWGLKTLGRYYPETAVEWLLHQTHRRPSALTLRKALTYLSLEQQAQVQRSFVR